MRRSNKFIKDVSLTRFLFEQDEDLFGDEEGGGDEAVEEETEEGAAEEDTTAADAEGEGEEEAEEEIAVSPEDEVKLAKSIDADLEALLIDFETQARKTKEIETTSYEELEDPLAITAETKLQLGMLLEQDESHEYEEEIDLDRFTAEVARLVKNYTNLLDMEKMLINKAREFVVIRYGEAAESELLDKLSLKHDIEITEPTTPRETDSEIPVAVGAGAGGAGGGE